MAKQNENQNSGSAHTDGGEAGVLSDDELLSHLGLSDELGQDGAETDEEDAGGENDGETDEEETEEESEADGEDEESESEESEEEETTEEDDDETEETEEESEESEEEEEKLPRSVTKLQKRVRKLTQRAKSAEEKVQTLEPEITRLQGELSEAKAPVIAPTDEDPMADLKTETAVNDRVSKAKMIRRWCLQNPEGGEVEGANGKIELTPAQVRERLMYAEDLIEAAPKRVAHLQETAKFDAFAKTAYPALFQSGSQESKVVETFITQCPEITRLPNWRLIVGDALLGGSVRLQKTKQKPVEKVKTAPRVAVKPSAAKPAPAGKVSATKNRAKFYETGSQEDLAAAIANGAI